MGRSKNRNAQRQDQFNDISNSSQADASSHGLHARGDSDASFQGAGSQEQYSNGESRVGMSDKLMRTKTVVADKLQNLTEGAKQQMSRVSDQVKTRVSRVDQVTRTNPYSFIAAAGIGGFLLARYLSKRSSSMGTVSDSVGNDGISSQDLGEDRSAVNNFSESQDGSIDQMASPPRDSTQFDGQVMI